MQCTRLKAKKFLGHVQHASDVVLDISWRDHHDRYTCGHCGFTRYKQSKTVLSSPPND